MADEKFSGFPLDAVGIGDTIVGLHGGVNAQFSAGTMAEQNSSNVTITGGSASLNKYLKTALNETGSTITAGTVVYSSGLTLGVPSVSPITNIVTQIPFGVASGNVLNGAEGFFQFGGELNLTISPAPGSFPSLVYVQSAGTIETTVTNWVAGTALALVSGSIYGVDINFQQNPNFSDFPLESVGAGDTAIGIHSGADAQFSIGNIISQNASAVNFTGGSASLDQYLKNGYNATGSTINSTIVVYASGAHAGYNSVSPITSISSQTPFGVAFLNVPNATVGGFQIEGVIDVTLATPPGSVPAFLYVQNNGTIDTVVTDWVAGTATVLISGSLYQCDINFQQNTVLTSQVTTISASSYLVQASDAGNTLLFTNAGGCDVTMPNDATTALPLGFYVNLINESATYEEVEVGFQGTDTYGGYSILQYSEGTRIEKIKDGTGSVWFIYRPDASGSITVGSSASFSLSNPIPFAVIYNGSVDTVITLPSFTAINSLPVGREFKITNNTAANFIKILSVSSSVAADGIPPGTEVTIKNIDGTGTLELTFSTDYKRSFVRAVNNTVGALTVGTVVTPNGYASSTDIMDVIKFTGPGTQFVAGIVVQASWGSGFTTYSIMQKGNWTFNLGAPSLTGNLYVNTSGALTTTQTAQYAGFILSNISGNNYECYIDFEQSINSLQKNNNLSDVASTTTAATNLNLGAASTINIGSMLVTSNGAVPTRTGAFTGLQYYGSSIGSGASGFRVGGVTGTAWDPTNIGDYSYADGLDNKAAKAFNGVYGGYNNSVSSTAILIPATIFGSANSTISGNCAGSFIIGGATAHTITGAVGAAIIGGGAITATHGGNIFIYATSGTSTVASTAVNQLHLLSDNGVIQTCIAGASSDLLNSTFTTGVVAPYFQINYKNSGGTLFTVNLSDYMLQNPQTGTTYQFVAVDNKAMVTASNASTQTYTVPNNATLSLPAGTTFTIKNIGVGDVNIVFQGTDTYSDNTLVAAGASLVIQKTVSATASNWIGIGGTSILTTNLNFPIPTGANGTYVIIPQSDVAYTITNITTICSSGTATATSNIAGTNVTATANAVSSSKQRQVVTALNSIAVGNALNVVLSSVSVALNINISYTLTYRQ